MKQLNSFAHRLMSALLVTLFVAVASVSAQPPSAFTYQGRLTDNNAAANGQYDFQFRIFDMEIGGTQVGSTIIVQDVQVTNGVFTVTLNPDSSVFTTNAARVIEIAVRPGASTGAFMPLSPVQPLTATPYAVQSLNATKLAGLTVDQFVQTGDARLSDARQPTAGSGFYIQNGTGFQSASNFNISGTGAANIFNATTQYNINGSRVLSIAGSGNLFAGNFAGAVTSTGSNNAFVGAGAAQNNTTGSENSFFGRTAGFLNSTGNSNSFFGRDAGINNTTGSNNTIIGKDANVGANNLNFATALGSGAVVSTSNTVVLGRAADTVQIPGNLNIQNGTIPESELGVAGMGFMGRGTFSGAGTQSYSPNGNSTQSSIADSVSMLSPNRACRAQNLSVRTSGSLIGWTFTLRVNNVGTPISCSISGGSNSCNSGAATFLIPAGQEVSLFVNKTPNGTEQFQFGWECR